ncbi:MAG: radical SAM protein [Deltaproteobacteria bacterium]|nr:MAG: radical SAM protein [Deltaproteobacteria bacterium]
MEATKYEEWSLGLHQQAASQRVPISGTLEVTRRCNLTCVHCYNNLPLVDREVREAELSSQEYCQILDEIVDQGCLWLLFTGGEPFAKSDFLEIYTHAKKKGLLITLFTNGTLITPRIADYLVQWRPFSVEITLYGHTKETYERVTGIPGSYERCTRGIRLFMERDLPLKLKTMAIRPNKHELWDMKQFVEQDLGLEFKFDAMINPRFDCSVEPVAVRLTPEEIVELDLLDPERAMEWRRFDERFTCAVEASEQCTALYRCGGGINSFAIDPYGMLRLCILSQSASYDLRKGSFQAGWKSFLSAVRQTKTTRQSKCITCRIRAMCGMCPANGELEGRDPEEPIDFLCELAHLRAYALDISVTPHGECEYCRGGSKYEELMRAVAKLRRSSNKR